jgi:hypothetical protein
VANLLLARIEIVIPAVYVALSGQSIADLPSIDTQVLKDQPPRNTRKVDICNAGSDAEV